MAVKKCCIDNCSSCSARKEDHGVTFHKFPKDITLHDTWISVTHHTITGTILPEYVCSRHFCKSDFQMYKDSKYILKSDAVPSIFPWSTTANVAAKMEMPNDTVIADEAKDDEKNVSNSSKQSDGENVDAIKKFIEEQEKEIQQKKSSSVPIQTMEEKNADPLEKLTEVIMGENQVQDSVANNESVIDMTPTQSDTDIEKKHVSIAKSMSEVDKGNNSMSLSVGSKVEAKDFREEWYSAEIMEVDYDEMEVLVHYETESKKHDEWINVSSPRLRPAGTGPVKSGAASIDSFPEIPMTEESKEAKPDDKGKAAYTVGERCLARWRDNRRFMATIQNDLGDGNYEIVFDDGCVWSCTTARLYKLKSDKSDTFLVSNPSTLSPGSYGAGPSSTQLANTPLPAYHTHLFDPTRDYLGSKSERRAMKRKLNIKEIFNIGQKKQKTPKTLNEKTPRKHVEKTKINTQMKLMPESEMKVEVKTENTAADAVASIIGTVNESLQAPKSEGELIQLNELLEAKEETQSETEFNDKDGKKLTYKIEDMDIDDQKVDLDPVLEEEVKLEKFDKQDADNHEEVLAMMKEVINKLEDGLHQEKKISRSSPRPEIKVIIPRIKLPLHLEVKSPHITVVVSKPDDIVPKPVVAESKLDAMETKPNVLETECVKTKSDDIEPKLDDIIPKTDIESIPDTTEYEPDNTDSIPEEKESIEIITVNPEDAEPIPETIPLSEESKPIENTPTNKEKGTSKKLSKVKKGKKLRLLQEKKVKKQVEKVKSELEEMKRQMEQMRKEMMIKTQVMSTEQTAMMPESFLLPGEWCCKWVNGQPVGAVSEMEYELKPEHSTSDKPPLPRRSVQVEDKRLPQGWTKHMVRRSYGNSAGKWDVVLISPENKRFHTKNEMRNYLEHNPDKTLQVYEHALTDFGVHLKLARRMGWITHTPDGVADGPTAPLPAGLMASTSPLVKKKKLGLKKREVIRDRNKAGIKQKRPKLTIRMKLPRPPADPSGSGDVMPVQDMDESALMPDFPPLEDGYVYVGALKVQVIENLLRCPAEGCFKNFRNNTLLQMHIKHYHRELRKMLGATPKVLDLAYARTKTVPVDADLPRNIDSKIIKVKFPRPPKREELKMDPMNPESVADAPNTPVRENQRLVPRSQDSPKLRQALNKSVKRPKVLLPVRRPEDSQDIPESVYEDVEMDEESEDTMVELPPMENLDFETAISTHTVTKPYCDVKKRKGDKKRKSFAPPPNGPVSEEDDWYGMTSDVDTRSSFPGSGTPDSKVDAKVAPVSSLDSEDKDANMYMYTENGERIKIVHMKREEIINCHCGFREEDGLMVQCELCLCWQHALCHNIQREADVPEKYTCSICLNPRRGRRSKRFLHDQDRLYEGLLPGAKPCETLRRSHELSGNLLRIEDALHALTVNYYVATKKDHPKLYLWAKDWEQLELQYTQEKLNSDYSDLNIMINAIGKENLPVKTQDAKDLQLDLATPPSEEQERYSQRENQLGSQALLSGLLSSPGGASLDLPISTSELERLAKTVEEQASPRPAVRAPQPEAAIENNVCRERLLRHIQRCQALVDSRLDSIEAQVAELESQDPSFEGDETADYFPRTKQTVQMLMRDLDTMEELGVIT